MIATGRFSRAWILGLYHKLLSGAMRAWDDALCPIHRHERENNTGKLHFVNMRNGSLQKVLLIQDHLCQPHSPGPNVPSGMKTPSPCRYCKVVIISHADHISSWKIRNYPHRWIYQAYVTTYLDNPSLIE